MTLRITPHRQLQLSQLHTQGHLSRSNLLQNQISSGERIHRPSEDPEGQRTILNQQAAIARLETQVASIQYSRTYLHQGNVELLDANQLLVQAKSLALEARQSTEQTDLNIIASELDGYLQTLESIANAKLDGRYLFSGATNDTRPFSGIVEGPTQYHGSQSSGEVVLANVDDVTVFLSGDEVFQHLNETGDARIDIFETIRTLKDDLRNRAHFSQDEWGARIDRRIDELQQSSDHVLNVVGEQSVSLQQFDRLQTRAEDLKHEAQILLSDTQSPDFATAVIQLQEEQNLLQYSLATVTRIFDLSVLDYL
ncbi:flagellin N-terminal helical domain-containing protein [Thalassoglobus polymorphus]|uniref:Flagellar hook-associated protein 3 n=1 Tax=Thalassoglobus polymorphus TaxID=2527994 RepID=A0A517QPL7_9PLAN|nr:hypothetical protein [Thalassoglobus polymorphus]QDT33588.1 Flagellar hook-associated protein 3 [Thalassoglobus polymorphus]